MISRSVLSAAMTRCKEFHLKYGPSPNLRGKKELSGDEKKSETFSFESGKIDEILSDWAALILQFKDLRDKKIIEENILERIVTIYDLLTCIRLLSLVG